MKYLLAIVPLSLLMTMAPQFARAEHEGKLQILLLGDSTTEGSIPRLVDKDGPHLDAHFGHLPGWFSDRHPNLAGYHVIGDETAKYLIPTLRERVRTAKP